MIVDTAYSRPIASYRPQIGDVIIWHAFIYRRWFGLLIDIDKSGLLTVDTAGLPLLLFAGKKEKREVQLDDITTSSGGEFAVLRAEKSILVWYV